ncbi:SRPBCC domain-containing protein [Thalassoglobus sp. JC818]|uniref:SRPBCC family protein n=1 Tax=Thalassoglobus sp. JC818 TaxID=3232136 RepID=UPI0034574BEA
MSQILHRIGIKAKPTEVFRAVNTTEGLREWWTNEIEDNRDESGTLSFIFRSPGGECIGTISMKITQQTSPTTLHWECVGGPDDWIGTKVAFKITEEDDQSTVIFSHSGWQEQSESFAHCNMKWATFLLSLRAYVESGQGRPSPNDIKIDNWN